MQNNNDNNNNKKKCTKCMSQSYILRECFLLITVQVLFSHIDMS